MGSFHGQVVISRQEDHMLHIERNVSIGEASISILFQTLQQQPSFAVRNRGLPRRFMSDNGTTFKAAARTISAIMRHEEIKQYRIRRRSGVGI